MESFPVVTVLTNNMKYRIPLYIILTAGIIISGGSAFAQKKWPGVVLYNIDLNGVSKRLIIDPVVRISKDEFSYPAPIPPDTWDKADANKLLRNYFDRYCKEEYPRGRKLELFIDGNKCGSAKITEVDSLNSCSPVVSEVEVSYTDSSARSFKGHGLVIASLPSARAVKNFPVDSIFEKTLYDYGKAEFLHRGVKKDIAENMEIKDIRAVDLDGDGKPEYLVNFFIVGEDAKHGEIESNMQYSFSAILKPSADGFKQVFFHYPEANIPEETHIYKFIDVLDLDGDGICEVIIQQVISMTAWDYIVLKKKGDVWVQVYEGAGGGC
jgi:hypothetical protein